MRVKVQNYKYGRIRSDISGTFEEIGRGINVVNKRYGSLYDDLEGLPSTTQRTPHPQFLCDAMGWERPREVRGKRTVRGARETESSKGDVQSRWSMFRFLQVGKANEVFDETARGNGIRRQAGRRIE
jgi:hypothetical protein